MSRLISRNDHRYAMRSRFCLMALFCFCFVSSIHAQGGTTPLQEIILSGDVTFKLPFVSGSFFVTSHSILQRLDVPTGQSTGALFVGSGSFGSSYDADAFDLTSNSFSIDISAVVSFPSGSDIFIRPGEIWAGNGSLLFEPADAGLPENSNIDAISTDPATGNLVFSMAHSSATPTILPTDLHRWNGATLSLFFDGFRVPLGLNIDAAHVLENGNILMSFDTSGTIDAGLLSAISFLDDDVLEYRQGTDDFRLALIPTELHFSWFPADLDALSAVELLPSHTVGGIISGLAANGLILTNNGSDNLVISANGTFTFTIPVIDGNSYNITVTNQPVSPLQFCSVTNGSGTISGANVVNVQVICVTDSQIIFSDSFENPF